MLVPRHRKGSTNGRYWTQLWGKRLIGDLTTEECRTLQAKLLAPGKWKPATINRHFAFLRHVFMIAAKEGRLTHNPVSLVKFFPEAHRLEFFTDEELLKLHRLIDGDDWKIVAFALERGLRRGEQFQLRWDQISFETRTLTLPLPKGDERVMSPSHMNH